MQVDARSSSSAVQPPATRELAGYAAIREAMALCMEQDKRVFLMGLGVPDPKGVFGTTTGLKERFGANRVMDMPCAENGMTGVLIGAALTGMRPVMSHARVDFAMLSMEQIANQAGKWSYMFGGQKSVPIVIRMVIGRGWGQGPQHSQSLQSWFAHVPGLKVVMPTTPYDAKGMLISAIEDNNPVIYIEHRWVHGLKGHVPDGIYRVPIGPSNIVREGSDVTIVGVSYMSLEARRAADELEEAGISAEVIDVRTIRPFDEETLVASVKKTGRLIVADTSWKTCGFGAEVLAVAAERAGGFFKSAPVRVTWPDCPAPTTPALAEHFYPRTPHIVVAARKMFGLPTDSVSFASKMPLDVPDLHFKGPF